MYRLTNNVAEFLKSLNNTITVVSAPIIGMFIRIIIPQFWPEWALPGECSEQNAYYLHVYAIHVINRDERET